MKLLILKYKNKMSTLPKVKTITDVMKSLKFKEPLDDKKIKSLLNLKIKDDQMFSLKNPNFLVEVTFLINTLGFEKSYNFLKTQEKQKDRESIIRNSECFNSSRKRFFFEITKDLRTVKVESWVQCKRCKSREVETETRQTRSADEGETTFYTCKSCNFQWKN